LLAATGPGFYVEEWRGFAAQKNSALEKCSGEWILSLDADEALSDQLAKEIWGVVGARSSVRMGMRCRGGIFFMGRFIRFLSVYGGVFIRISSFRLFSPRGRRSSRPGQCMRRCIFPGKAGRLKGDMVHDAYPSLEAYIGAYGPIFHAGRGSMRFGKAKVNAFAWAFVADVVVNPVATFCL